MSATEFVYLY